MKTMKKLLSIVMVLALVLSLGVSALAATVTITQPEGKGAATHSYTAYQIFSGTQNIDSGDRLASVVWGSDINGDAFLTALKASKNFTSVDFSKCVTPADVVKAMGKDEKGAGPTLTDAELREFGRLALANLKEGTAGIGIPAGTTEIELPDGYYVFKDTTPDSDLNNDVRNDIVLDVTDDVAIQFKNERPSSEKKVIDTNDTTGETSGWQDSADHDIGDVIQYRLKADLHHLQSYDYYYLQFQDAMCAGLTYNGDAKVFFGDPDDETPDTDVTEDFAFLKEVDLEGDYPQGFTWTCDNVKKFTGDATDATIYILYTCTLNNDAVVGPTGNPNEMRIEFSRNPNDASDHGGHTPWDKNIVFTYEFDANKVDANNNPLHGAAFTLLKVFKTGGESVQLNEGTPYAKTYENVKVVAQYTVEDDKTTFEFKGLDDGDYILVESTVPDGYNKADDITFTISAVHDTDSADPKLTGFQAKGDNIDDVEQGGETETAVTGEFKFDVVNRTGLELPSTGGIGTTIFYVVGAVLVAGAVILLVTKKRVSGANK